MCFMTNGDQFACTKIIALLLLKSITVRASLKEPFDSSTGIFSLKITILILHFAWTIMTGNITPFMDLTFLPSTDLNREFVGDLLFVLEKRLVGCFCNFQINSPLQQFL